jgi:hypothetical protein
VEIEDRNGSLRSPKLPSPPPLDELTWQIAAVGIIGLYRLAGNDNVVLCVISREREAVWVSRRRTVLFFSIHLLLNQLSNTYWTYYL